jgi:hypothetical protein
MGEQQKGKKDEFCEGVEEHTMPVVQGFGL